MSNEIKLIFSGDASGAVAATNKVATAAGKLDRSLKQSATGTNQASFALTNLARVAQDAPFGFIGIANNLDPLLSSFQRLTKETGSAGNALKVLGAGLLGPAGLAVGFSVVSSLVVTAIQKYGSLGAAIDAIFGSTSAAVQATRDLNKAYIEAQASIAGEIATLNSLIGIAKNKTLSDEARQQAIDKLNKEYGKYLPNLSLENIATDKITVATDRLTQSMIRRAKIAGLQALITKNAEREADAYLNLSQSIEDSRGGFTKLVDDFFRANTGISLTDRKAIEFNKTLKDSEVRATRFQEALNKLLSEDAQSGTLFTELPKKLKDVKNNAADAATELEKILTATRVQGSEQFAKAIGSSFKVGEEFGLTIDTSKTVTGINAATAAVRTFGDELAKQAEESATNNLLRNQELQAYATATAISGVLSPAFTDLFDNLLSGGQNAFQAFAASLKKIISKLIATAITAAILAAIIKSIPGVGGGAAIGDFFGKFKSLFSSLSGIPGFASGTNNFRGGFAMVGERGPEAVQLPRGSQVIPNHLLGGSQRQELFAFIDNRGIYLSNLRGGISAGRLG